MKRILTAVILALSLTAVAPAAEAGILSRKGECGIKVVALRIQGTAGQAFEYAGKSYEIPAHGTLEVVARKADLHIQTEARTINLEERRPDQFGIVTVDLDRSRSEAVVASK